MKVKVLSDLHLEFQAPGKNELDPGEGDVLVLAGDIITAVDLLDGGSYCDMFLRFFAKAAKGYNKVLYTPGNHEYYEGDWEEIDNILRTIPDIHFLQDDFIEYNGWTFYGATLWTDFDNFNTTVMNTAQGRMNDYNCIYRGASPINALTTLATHQETISNLSQRIVGMGERVFVFTHHAPSLQSTHNSPRVSDCPHAYASNLEQFILDNENIKFWAHGHVHETQNYPIGQCQVVANPRGYVNVAVNPTFVQEQQIVL